VLEFWKIHDFAAFHGQNKDEAKNVTTSVLKSGIFLLKCRKENCSSMPRSWVIRFQSKFCIL